MTANKMRNLTPLIFRFYLNDYPNCLSILVPAMFADDTNLSVAGTLVEDIETRLNFVKTNVKSKLKLVVMTEVNHAKSTERLGVTIDELRASRAFGVI